MKKKISTYDIELAGNSGCCFEINHKNLQSLALPDNLLSLYKMLDLVYVYNPSNIYDRYPSTAGTSAVVYDIIPTGGLVAGGVGSQSFNDVVEVSGGLFLSGNSFNNTVVYQTVVGGVGVNGSILTSYFYTVFGGANLNGPSSVSSILAENGDTLTNENNIPISTEESIVVNLEYLVFNPVLSGLCLLNGSASEVLIKTEIKIINEIAIGGSLAGGVGLETAVYNVVSTGGSRAGGVGLETAVYNVVSTGGSRAGGVGLETFSDVVEVSGGSRAGGVGLETAVYNVVSTGGSRAGGVGSISTIYNIVLAGGSLAGGVGLETAVYNITPTGGSRAGGVGLQTFSDIVEVTGGSRAGGVGLGAAVYNIVSTGGLLAGGVGLQTITFNIVGISEGLVFSSVSASVNTIFNPNTIVILPSDSLLSLYQLLKLVYVYNPSNVYDRYPGLEPIPVGGVSLSGQSISSVVFVASGGSLAGGVASQTITYNETSSGGLLAGGIGLDSFAYNFIFTGGSIAGGVGSQTFSDFVEVDGGILASGFALQTFSDIVEVDGGILANGIALQTTIYNHNLVLVDPSDEVWLSNHLGLIYIYDNINHDDEFETISYASRFFTLGYSGSVLAGGSSVVARVQEHVPTGGSLASGVASQTITYNITPTGGSLAGGVGSQTFSDVVEVGGGLLAGGVASAGKYLLENTSGGTSVGGVGSQYLSYFFETSGGSLTSGFAINNLIDQIEVTGGVFVNGTSVAGKYLSNSFSGGLTLSGKSDQSFVDLVEVGGTLLVGGLSLQSISETTSGGLVIGGSIFSNNMDVGGGILLSGSTSVNANYNPDYLELPTDDLLLLYRLLRLTYIYGYSNVYNRYHQGFIGGVSLGGSSKNTINVFTEMFDFGVLLSGNSIDSHNIIEFPQGGILVTGDIFKGSALISGSASVELFANTKNLRFGRSTFGEVVYSNADYQSIFLWNRSLTDAEIENVYLNSHKIREDIEDSYFPLFFDQNFDIQTQGGIKVSGTALASQDVEMSGGSKVGGEFGVSIVFAPSGGLSIPPTSADVNKQNNISSTGGVKTSGLADLTDLSSGGLVCSGSVLLRVIANIFPTGFAKVSGSASDLCTFDVVGKNGILANGRAINFATYDLKVSGGSIVSGNSAFGISKDITSRINLLASGSADLRTIFGPRATSGSRCSGSAVVDAQYNLDLSPSGGRLGGTSQIFVARDELFNGGCLLSGSINLLKETSLISKVSINLGGLSPIACNYKIDSLSGCAIGGFGVVYADYSITSKQSITVSGSGVSFVRNNIFSQINLICGGLASDEMDKIYFMEGGLRSSGSAESLVYYDIRPLGGILNSGRSNVSLIVSKTSSVEVFVSGLSLNIFINSTSGGIVLSGFSILVDQRVYNYIVSTKRQNRLLLGSNSELDENNYYYEQSVGGCKVGGSLVVTYVSGASGVTLGGTSQPVADRLYSYIVSTKKQNRLLLGSNSEFDKNNYYYEQTEGGVAVGLNFVVVQISGASGVTLSGTSQPVTNRLCDYIVSTKKQNRLLLGGNSEFDKNNYYHKRPEGGCEASGRSIVTYVSGASGVTLGGTSQPIANRFFVFKPQGQITISGLVLGKRNSYRNEFLGQFKLSGLADCQLVCQKLTCDEGGLKCKTKTPCESVLCDYSKEYFANCKYNKQNIRRCKTTSALLPAISNCRQKGYLPVKNRTRKVNYPTPKGIGLQVS